ncbi:MAG: translation initiation factor SUI1 [Elusimicrobia bacterium RIFOXYB2_FULL_49_7]|nr:MAG: translation initiation factor SUI1 [Elusimicrobia bacterium RIFOXYB2_FULL_49_7]
MHSSSANNALVYSTGQGKLCPTCGSPVSDCRCGKGKFDPPKDGVIRVGRETQGRKGNGVTLITGLPFQGPLLIDFAKKLKQQLGCGGTVVGRALEIQGDQRNRILDILKKQGLIAKRAGG